MNDKKIRWTLWEGATATRSGKDTLDIINGYLGALEKKAAEVLKQTGADHVVYGIKHYRDDGKGGEKVYYFNLYMRPMMDKDFEEKVVPMKDVYIYALHKRGGTEC